jgi:short-subunit dehydrogenase
VSHSANRQNGGWTTSNVTALTRLTYAAAPAFVKRETGTIINIGSAAGISVEALNGVYGASKAYVLAFSLSLQHELTSKGIRVQAVLPARTATDGWEVAGLPWQQQPASIIMSAEDMVDAALVGLDQGELVTIPSLHNGDEWTRFEAARRGMLPQFGTSVPAPRYRKQARMSA